jgi:hypothetical protein
MSGCGDTLMTSTCERSAVSLQTSPAPAAARSDALPASCGCSGVSRARRAADLAFDVPDGRLARVVVQGEAEERRRDLVPVFRVPGLAQADRKVGSQAAAAARQHGVAGLFQVPCSGRARGSAPKIRLAVDSGFPGRPGAGPGRGSEARV